MMPRPTTTSAAATTITKNTAVWPPMSSRLLGERDEREVHGVEHQLDAHEHHQRVAAHQHADRADARTARAASMQVPRRGGCDGGDHAALLSLSAASPVAARPLAGQQHRADDGDDEQHRGELEGEHVVAEQVAGERLDVAVGIRGVAGVATPSPRADGGDRGPRMTAATDEAEDARRRRRPASGRWIGNGSMRRSSALSTPSSMMTNRNSTTMAPA